MTLVRLFNPDDFVTIYFSDLKCPIRPGMGMMAHYNEVYNNKRQGLLTGQGQSCPIFLILILSLSHSLSLSLLMKIKIFHKYLRALLVIFFLLSLSLSLSLYLSISISLYLSLFNLTPFSSTAHPISYLLFSSRICLVPTTACPLSAASTSDSSFSAPSLIAVLFIEKN
ncbi:unnamed protein product [Acanthosepion pharaonis]|uniref:Uncharacterized protein n=1 Tax=Acanthosepion pharaonis TaxID=158019 RepID=A0A812C051_ACAPH|nr:unnamed protein product [Sepia pharaonis]